MSWVRKAARIFVGLVLLLSALLLGLALLRSPVAASLAMAAGALARSLGQRHNLKRLDTSSKPADLATFTYSDQAVSCSFNQTALVRHIHPWSWKIAASLAASVVCLAAQHLVLPVLSLLPLYLSNIRWVHDAIGACSMALPVFFALFFLWAKGPERRWTHQVKAAIEARAARSIAAILKDKEIHGLEAGIEILGQELGLDRRNVYRIAVTHRLRSHTAEAVLYPEATVVLLQAMTGSARQDLRNLGAAVEIYRRVECRLRAIQTLVSTLRDPLHEMRVEELHAELKQLPMLAANRQWEDLQEQADRLEEQLQEVHAKVRRNAASVPAMTLPPGSDPYRLLGVSVSTPTSSIRKLRLRLAQLYHPDLSDSTGNGAKMAEVNAAFDAVMQDREKDGRPWDS